MFERDYFQRLVQQFFDALNEIIHGASDKVKEAKINDMYPTFFDHEKTWFLNEDADWMLDSLASHTSQEKMTKIEMLAALMFHDANVQTDEDQKINLLRKSQQLFLYLDKNSNVYDYDRTMKLDDIRRLLNSLT